MTAVVASVERADPSRTGRLTIAVDALLMAGLFSAIALSSVDWSKLDVAVDGSAWRAIQIAQRLSVHGPVAVAVLAGVPIWSALRRLPLAPFLAFSAWACVVSVFTVDPIGELDRTVWFFGFTMLVALLVRRRGWEVLLIVIATVGLALVGAGLVAHAAGVVEAETLEYFDSGLFDRDRVSGLASRANSFGRSAANLVIVGLILSLYKRRRSLLRLGLASIALGLPALVLSQSRLSVLSAVLAVMLILARWRVWARILGGVAVIATSVIVGIVLMTGSLGPFARTEGSDEAATLLGRTQVWEEAIDLSVRHPLTGIGIEGLTARYTELEEAGYFGWDPANAHNVVLQVAASHGIVAAWLLVSALVLGARMAWTSEQLGTFEVIMMFALQGTVEAILLGDPTISAAMLIGTLAATAIDRRPAC